MDTTSLPRRPLTRCVGRGRHASTEALSEGGVVCVELEDGQRFFLQIQEA